MLYQIQFAGLRVHKTHTQYRQPEGRKYFSGLLKCLINSNGDYCIINVTSFKNTKITLVVPLDLFVLKYYVFLITLPSFRLYEIHNLTLCVCCLLYTSRCV